MCNIIRTYRKGDDYIKKTLWVNLTYANHIILVINLANLLVKDFLI